MKKTEEKLFAFINQFGLIRNGEKLLVGFSGGPDSVFCLYFLNKFKRKFRIEIAAVHVNHNIRQTSSYDADFCSSFCSEKKIRFFSESVNVLSYAKMNKVSAEEAGRELRYSIFEKLADNYNYDKIVTAHNLDDNAETVLLNLVKGSGLNGLTGIPVQRGKIIRPVLCLSKSEILSYLRQAKINYVIDETNKSNEYQRNFLRNEIIPKLKEKLNPVFPEAVFKLSDNLRNLNEYIEKEVIEFINSGIKIIDSGFELNLKSSKNIHPFVFSEAIRNFYADKLKIGFQKSDLEKLYKLIQSQKGKKNILRNGWSAIRENDSIVYIKMDFGKKSEESPFVDVLLNSNQKLNIDVSTLNIDSVSYVKDGKTEFIDADKIHGRLVLRKWKPGDKFIPIGMKNHRLISDFLTDLKFPAAKKKNVFVLVNRNNIVWVVGLRISDDYKITKKTKKIMRLSINDKGQ